MPTIPTTRARPAGVSTNYANRQMGRKLNIHMMDAIFENNIQDWQNLGRTGREIGDNIGRAGKAIRSYVDQQQSVKDKTDFTRYQEEMQKFYAEEWLPNATKDQDINKWGEDFESAFSVKAKELKDGMQLSETARNMGDTWFRNQSRAYQVNMAGLRANAKIQRVDTDLTDLSNKAVQNGNLVDAQTFLTLRAENSPKRLPQLQHDIVQAKGMIWYNGQVKTIERDPNNYDPRGLELSEIPDYIVDKEDAKKKLVLQWHNVRRQNQGRDADVQLEKTNEFYQLVIDNELRDGWIKTLAEEKDSFGKPLFEKKTINSMLGMYDRMMKGEEKLADIKQFSTLEREAYFSDKDDKFAMAKINEKKIQLGSIRQMQRIDSLLKVSKKEKDEWLKFQPEIKSAYKKAVKDFGESFNIYDEFEETEAGVFDVTKVKKEGWWERQKRSWFGGEEFEYQHDLNKQKSFQQYMDSKAELMNWIKTQKTAPTTFDVMNKAKEIKMPFDVENKALELARPIQMNARGRAIVQTGMHTSGRRVVKYSDGTTDYAD